MGFACFCWIPWFWSWLVQKQILCILFFLLFFKPKVNSTMVVELRAQFIYVSSWAVYGSVCFFFKQFISAGYLNFMMDAFEFTFSCFIWWFLIISFFAWFWMDGEFGLFFVWFGNRSRFPFSWLNFEKWNCVKIKKQNCFH